MRQRQYLTTCWTCGGYGITGRYLNRNIHISYDCPTCNGRGYIRLRRHK